MGMISKKLRIDKIKSPISRKRTKVAPPGHGKKTLVRFEKTNIVAVYFFLYPERVAEMLFNAWL